MNDFSQIETEILIAKYGLERVLNAVAAASGRSLQELRTAIEQRKSKPKPSKRKEFDIDALVSELAITDPSKSAVLRSLATAYNNRSLFPAIRDIQVFLGSKDAPRKPFKSRADAVGPLFRALSSLNIEDLRRLDDQSRKTERGDLHTLAQGILNR